MSAFTVVVMEDERDIHDVPVKPESPAVMAAKPESPVIMATTPQSPAITAAMPERVTIVIDIPDLRKTIHRLWG